MIKEMQKYIMTCPLLEDIPIEIDFTNSDDISYGLQQAGNGIVKKDCVGNKTHKDNFIFYFRGFSSDDYTKLSNNNFTENLKGWFEDQDDKENYPVIENVEFNSIIATNSILLDVSADGQTSLYQIQLQVNYTRLSLEERGK